jgi:hypothetical protein
LTAEKTLPPTNGRVVFYAVRVISKKNGQSVLSRSSCLLSSFRFSVIILSLSLSFLCQIENVNKYAFNYGRIMQIAYTDSATDGQTELSACSVHMLPVRALERQNMWNNAIQCANLCLIVMTCHINRLKCNRLPYDRPLSQCRQWLINLSRVLGLVVMLVMHARMHSRRHARIARWWSTVMGRHLSSLTGRTFCDLESKQVKKGKVILVTGREGPYGCETSRLTNFL